VVVAAGSAPQVTTRPSPVATTMWVPEAATEKRRCQASGGKGDDGGEGWGAAAASASGSALSSEPECGEKWKAFAGVEGDQ